MGPKLFAPPPPPQDRVKLFAPPPFKEWKVFTPPPTIRLNLQATAYKLPQNFLCPPFSMAKTFSAPPFRRGKTSSAPPSRFVAPPLPVISDQSLRRIESRYSVGNIPRSDEHGIFLLEHSNTSCYLLLIWSVLNQMFFIGYRKSVLSTTHFRVKSHLDCGNGIHLSITILHSPYSTRN